MARKTKTRRHHAPANGSDPLTSESPAVQQRLERIAAHYDLLEEMLADLETRVPPAGPGEGGPSPPLKPR